MLSYSFSFFPNRRISSGFSCVYFSYYIFFYFQTGLTSDSNGELPTSPVHLGISPEDSSSSPQLFQHHDEHPSLTTILPGPMMHPIPFGRLPPGVFMPPPQSSGAPYLPPPPPPPPGAPYLPPPPPPLFPDRRPPPLGRMSSPPPHHYSPPPPDPRRTYSPYDDCSPPPSPPPMRYRTSPPHRDEFSDRFRSHRSPPPSDFKTYSSPVSHQRPHRDNTHGPSPSNFRPLPPSEHRNNPRDSKGVVILIFLSVCLHVGMKKIISICHSHDL